MSTAGRRADDRNQLPRRDSVIMSEIEARIAYLTLLETHIETFEDLEIVLALSRGRTTAIAVSELAASVGLDEPVVLATLERLKRNGLVVGGAEGTYILDRSDARVSCGLDYLQSQYESHRVDVMSRMNANAIERIRTAALRAFARAFLFRKTDG